MLFFISTTFTQAYAYVSNTVVDIAIFHGSEALGPDNAITVPVGNFFNFCKRSGLLVCVSGRWVRRVLYFGQQGHGACWEFH